MRMDKPEARDTEDQRTEDRGQRTEDGREACCILFFDGLVVMARVSHPIPSRTRP